MRKKLLLAENSNLFAEVERKNTENEGLKIRLEDSRKAKETLEKENAELLEKLKASSDYINTLEKKVGELEEENNNLKAELIKTRESCPPPILKEVKEETTEQTPLSETDNSIKSVIEEISVYEAPAPESIPQTPHLSSEQREALRTKGAEEIGRVTKVVALATAKLKADPNENTDHLYSLALGTNESFKMQVLSIVEAEGDFDELCNELHQKATLVIEKLNSL